MIANVEIRPMSHEDLDRVLEIDRQSFSVPWTARSYRFELERNPVSRLFVAEYEGRVVGYIGLWELIDEGHISTLAVAPGYRRRGIASRLIETGLRSLAERGVELASLEVRESNNAAQELYRGFGFEVAGRRRAYYRDNREDALIMSLHGLRSALAQEV